MLNREIFRLSENKVIKDELIEMEQAEMRKEEVERFKLFREKLNKIREEERKFRISSKTKQIEDCETLQVTNKF